MVGVCYWVSDGLRSTGSDVDGAPLTAALVSLFYIRSTLSDLRLSVRR